VASGCVQTSTRRGSTSETANRTRRAGRRLVRVQRPARCARATSPLLSRTMSSWNGLPSSGASNAKPGGRFPQAVLAGEDPPGRTPPGVTRGLPKDGR
jgi:hypothetical protein